MTDVNQLITEHLDIWTSATAKKSSAGRGNSGAVSLYGIKKLRELILELAVRGKLVPQDDAEGTGEKLLKKITSIRKASTSQKAIRKPELPPQVQSDEFRFDLPKNWAWTRLVELAEITPKNNAPDNQLASFVPMPEIQTNHTGMHGQEERNWGEIKKGYTHFADGDVALAKITPCFENSKAAVFSGLQNGIGAGTTELHVARLFSDTVIGRFILLHLKAPSFLEDGKLVMTGSAGQKRVPRWYFTDTPIALPPTAEQHRIVAKVDKLMALCDALERQAEDSLKAHQTLVETCLGTLTNSESPEDLTQNWTRIEAHFDTLFSTEKSIISLKLTVLKLASSGLLTTQLHSDTPAEEFVSRVATERGRFNSGRKKIAGKTVDSKALLGDLSQLPSGWKAEFLGNLVFNRDSERAPLSVAQRKGRSGPYDYYGASGVIDSLDDYLFDEPLLLIGEDGANLINRSTPIAFVARGKYWVNNHAHVLGAVSETFLDYMAIYINSISLLPYVTGTAQPKMNQAKMNTIPVWVPPEEEQARIVERVRDLFEVCDRLLESLPVSKAIECRFADTLTSKIH